MLAWNFQTVRETASFRSTRSDFRSRGTLETSCGYMGRWACIISGVRKKSTYLAGQSASTREQRWNCIVSEAGLVVEGIGPYLPMLRKPSEYLQKCARLD